LEPEQEQIGAPPPRADLLIGPAATPAVAAHDLLLETPRRQNRKSDQINTTAPTKQKEPTLREKCKKFLVKISTLKH